MLAPVRNLGQRRGSPECVSSYHGTYTSALSYPLSSAQNSFSMSLEVSHSYHWSYLPLYRHSFLLNP